MRRAVTFLLAAAFVFCCAGVAGRRAVAAPPGAPRVTLIGDSTMAAMRWYGYDDDDPDTLANNDIREIIGNDDDLLFSAESCRRLVVGSCRGREGYVPVSTLPLMQGDFRGQMGSTLVIMAGYDDVSIDAGVDAVVDEATAQGVTNVIWLTYHTSTAYRLPGGQSAAQLYERHNASLVAATARHPTLQLLDWNTYASPHPEWFASAGVHLDVPGTVALARFIKERLDAVVGAGPCSAARAQTGSPSTPIGQPAVVAVPPAGYTARTPQRVLDTREPTLGGAAGKLGAGRTVSIDVSGTVPANASAVAMTVTAVDPCGPGFLSVFDCGVRPGTSNVNDVPGRNTAGLVFVPTDATGHVCIATYATTDVVVDVIGSFGPGGQRFSATGPTRWVDTRGGPALLGDVRGVRTTGQDTTVPVAGVGGVPADATATWINLTIADPTAATVLTAYPGPCATAPTASTVNARPDRSAAASAIVGLGADGSICVHTVAGSSGVVVDVAGWFGPSGTLGFRPTTPERLTDTREISPTAPAGPTAVGLGAVSVLNVTAAEATTLGWLAARPCGVGATSSIVNTGPGESTANLTVVAPGDGAAACVPSYRPTHVVVDRFGEFVPS
jgi:hypothetical protein